MIFKRPLFFRYGPILCILGAWFILLVGTTYEYTLNKDIGIFWNPIEFSSLFIASCLGMNFVKATFTIDKGELTKKSPFGYGKVYILSEILKIKELKDLFFPYTKITFKNKEKSIYIMVDKQNEFVKLLKEGMENPGSS